VPLSVVRVHNVSAYQQNCKADTDEHLNEG